MKSLFLKLDLKDLAKGALLAFITVVVTAVYQAIEAETAFLTWAFFAPVLKNAILAVVAYFIKNFLTNSQGKFLTKES